MAFVALLAALWFGSLAGVAPAQDICHQGYRQQNVIADFALGRAWTVYASCTHPETPRVAILLDRSAAPAASSIAEAAAPEAATVPPLVRIGRPVRMWLSTPVSRIALSGTALENGASGATVRVRVMPGGRVLDGIVRGADSVELLAIGFERGKQ